MLSHRSDSLTAIRLFYVVGVFVTVLWLSLSGTASAQVSMASVNGTVRDSSGSVVPEANLSLHNIDTGVVRRTVTNPVGNYVFLDVPPGTYTLEVTKSGFTAKQLLPFTLVVNQTATFDVALEVGPLSQSVTVQAVGADVQSSTAELGLAFTRKEVLDLPLNGRNFTELLSLTPGITPISVAQNSSGGTQHVIGAFEFPAVNGQRNRSNLFTLDGINDQGALRNTYDVAPILDGIQEFKVQSHNDQAEFGGVTGGIINIVTKSGTNQLHGSLWEFIKNDAFDARNFFNPSVSPYKQDQYGGTLGGAGCYSGVVQRSQPNLFLRWCPRLSPTFYRADPVSRTNSSESCR